MKRECVAAEASVTVEPKMERKEFSTTAAGLEVSIEFRKQLALLQHGLGRERRPLQIQKRTPARWSGQARL
jgi:hypothetical protein